jgi:ComF family protein
MLADALAPIAQLLWPARCAACDDFVPHGIAFCEPCVASILPIGRACPRCALPVPERAGGECRSCAVGAFPFVGVAAVLSYGGALAEALLRFKHGRRAHLASSLGRLLVPALRAAVEQGGELLLPVPLHPRRLRSRGFNQSLELAREARRGLPRAGRGGGLRLLPDTLARTIDTPSLGHHGPRERRALVEGAFAVRDPTAVQGRRIVLLDDVMTSGATAAACAQALLGARAEAVQVLTLARAL